MLMLCIQIRNSSCCSRGEPSRRRSLCIWNWGIRGRSAAGVEVSVDAVSRSGAVAVAAGVNQVGEGACVYGTGGSEEEVLQEWK